MLIKHGPCISPEGSTCYRFKAHILLPTCLPVAPACRVDGRHTTMSPTKAVDNVCINVEVEWAVGCVDIRYFVCGRDVKCRAENCLMEYISCHVCLCYN